jgi:pimeloyl-ACP methyl ester carboxylesterase
MTDKPPILFLHGAFAGPEVWTRFVAPWFTARGHRVAAPRLPGPVDGEPRLRDYVRRARAAAAEFGEPPVVVGHSLGGLVAQHLAAEGRVAGAVLVASPGPFGLGPAMMHLATRAPDVLTAMMVVQAGGGALIGRDMVRRALFTEETPDNWIAQVAAAPQREPLAALLDGMTWDIPAWPLVRRVPILAIMGDADAFVPMSDLWAISTFLGAETELMPNRGHGLPIDPAWKSLAWRINAWLDERGVGALPPPWAWPALWAPTAARAAV